MGEIFLALACVCKIFVLGYKSAPMVLFMSIIVLSLVTMGVVSVSISGWVGVVFFLIYVGALLVSVLYMVAVFPSISTDINPLFFLGVLFFPLFMFEVGDETLKMMKFSESVMLLNGGGVFMLLVSFCLLVLWVISKLLTTSFFAFRMYY